MEEIQCIFCNKSSEQIVIEENGFQCKKCPSCGLIYVSPRPLFLEIKNIYREDQANISAESRVLGAFGRRLHERHHLRIIKKFIKSGSLLEIGPGAGSSLDEARKEGFEVYGIELNNIQADFIRNKLGIPCESSPLDVSSFGGRKFDIVYHRDVISHFYDPIAEFKKINDRLSANGVLVFETGNLGDVKEKYYRFFTNFQLPDHLFSFNEGNLKELLRRTGFEFIKIYRYSKMPLLLIIKISKRAIDFIRSREKINPAPSSGVLNPAGRFSLTIHPRSRAAGYPGRCWINHLTETPSFHTPNSNLSRFGFNKLIRDAYHDFSYYVLYKIGYLMPKKGQPLSIIVVASKR